MEKKQYKYRAWASDKYGDPYAAHIAGDTPEEIQASATRQGLIVGQIVPTGTSLPAPVKTPTPPVIKQPIQPIITQSSTQPLSDEEAGRLAEQDNYGGFGSPMSWEEQKLNLSVAPELTAEQRLDQILRTQQQRNLQPSAWQDQDTTWKSTATITGNVPMSQETKDKTQSTLDTDLANFKKATNLIISQPWYSEDTKDAELEKTRKLYTDKAVKELKSLAMYNASDLKTFIPQLQAMAQQGFKMTDINKTIKDIAEQTMSPVRPEIESWSERYIKPEILAQAKQGLQPYGQALSAQQQQLQAMPQEYKDLYFGTLTQRGEQEQLKTQAEQQKTNLISQIASEKTQLLETNNLANTALDIEKTSQLQDIEEQRQQSKNYLAGTLAKMGALTTTGVGADSLSQLDLKYQTLKTNIQTKTTQIKEERRVTYEKLLRDIDIKQTETIQSIDNDLSKTDFEKRKEIFKIETDADNEINKLNLKYLDKVSETEINALKEYKTLSATFIKNWFTTVSGGQQTQLLGQIMPKILNYQKEQQAIKNTKEKLTIALKQKALAKPYYKTKTGKTPKGKAGEITRFTKTQTAKG